jgi:hypothetical protein
VCFVDQGISYKQISCQIQKDSHVDRVEIKASTVQENDMSSKLQTKLVVLAIILVSTATGCDGWRAVRTYVGFIYNVPFGRPFGSKSTAMSKTTTKARSLGTARSCTRPASAAPFR